jgi:sugar-specific transcriptional regulator TrmB
MTRATNLEEFNDKDDGPKLELFETKVSQPEGIDQVLWQNLLGIGLTPSEAKVYLALIHHGSLTAVDACKLSGVQRAKIYEILTNLSAYGLCYEISGKKKKYSAVNPQEGLQRKMEAARRDLELKEQLAIAAGDKLMPFFKSREDSASLVSSTIHFLSNANLTAKVYLKLLQEAQQEILYLSKAPYNISVEASQAYVHAALKKGVRVRALFELAECQNKEALAVILENQAKGVEVKVLPTLPSKLIMGDQNLALLILNDLPKDKFDPSKGPAQTQFSGMLVEHVSTVCLLRIAFESLWQQAVPLKDFLGTLT